MHLGAAGLFYGMYDLSKSGFHEGENVASAKSAFLFKADALRGGIEEPLNETLFLAILNVKYNTLQLLGI